MILRGHVFRFKRINNISDAVQTNGGDTRGYHGNKKEKTKQTHRSNRQKKGKKHTVACTRCINKANVQTKTEMRGNARTDISQSILLQFDSNNLQKNVQVHPHHMQPSANVQTPKNAFLGGFEQSSTRLY